MEIVQIYGFGSYFTKKKCPNDIDLLILHNDLSLKSINFALHVKKKIVLQVNTVDITILSASEEREFDFLVKSGAHKITEMSQHNTEVQIDLFIRKIESICTV